MVSITSVIIWILFAFWCNKIASKQGRDTSLASILGIFFGIFAVIGYYIAGDKKGQLK